MSRILNASTGSVRRIHSFFTTTQRLCLWRGKREVYRRDATLASILSEKIAETPVGSHINDFRSRWQFGSRRPPYLGALTIRGNAMNNSLFWCHCLYFGIAPGDNKTAANDRIDARRLPPVWQLRGATLTPFNIDRLPMQNTWYRHSRWPLSQILNHGHLPRHSIIMSPGP